MIEENCDGFLRNLGIRDLRARILGVKNEEFRNKPWAMKYGYFEITLVSVPGI